MVQSMFKKLLGDIDNTRHYAVINVKGKPKVCCSTNGEWIIDAKCKVLNDLLLSNNLEQKKITGWIEFYDHTSH